MTQTEDTLFGESDVAEAGESYGRHSTGILPSHVLKRLIRARREVLASDEIEDAQIQPASIDLRVGAMAWRVRASFLPGPNATVREKLAAVALHEIDLTEGAVLETRLCLCRAAAWRAWSCPRASPASPIRKARRAGSTFSPG